MVKQKGERKRNKEGSLGMCRYFPAVRFTNGEQWKRKGGRGDAERRSKGRKICQSDKVRLESGDR